MVVQRVRLPLGARSAVRGKARRGVARLGRAGEWRATGRHSGSSPERPRRAGNGTAVLGPAGLGWERRGVARPGREGERMAYPGGSSPRRSRKARRGIAVQGLARHREAWRGRDGAGVAHIKVRVLGPHARPGRSGLGKARRGAARPGEARERRRSGPLRGSSPRPPRGMAMHRDAWHGGAPRGRERREKGIHRGSSPRLPQGLTHNVHPE